MSVVAEDHWLCPHAFPKHELGEKGGVHQTLTAEEVLFAAELQIGVMECVPVLADPNWPVEIILEAFNFLYIFKFVCFKVAFFLLILKVIIAQYMKQHL